MLDSDAIDAVYIPLPNHLHAQWTIRALRSGKHVLCEKPFALTLDEVDQMITAAEETGNVLAEAFMYRHHPQTKLVGELIQQGKIGDVTLVRAIFNFRFHTRDNIRLAPEMGGGSLWDVGVYPVSLAQYIMGEAPQWVVGDQWLGNTGVDEDFAGQLHYSGGRMAQIASSFRTPFYTFAEIIGTTGRFQLTTPFTGDGSRFINWINADGDSEMIATPDEYLYLGEIRDIHAAILDGQENYLTLAESRNHVRTVLALYEAAQTGRLVTL